MDKQDLIDCMIANGVKKKSATKRFNEYREIPTFSYNYVRSLSPSRQKYNCFGDAYNDYGIYIFYKSGTFDIQYIGAAALEPFRRRLTQQFNASHSGLPAMKPKSISILNACDTLILYGKYNSAKAEYTHFDEDFLIGLFQPPLNDR